MVKKEVFIKGELRVTEDEEGWYRANFYTPDDPDNPVVLGRFAGAPEFVKDLLDNL